MIPRVWASLGSAVSAGLVVWLIRRPPRRLGPRVRPYTIGSRSALGGAADVAGAGFGSPLGRIVEPMVRRVAVAVGGLIDRAGEEGLLRRIRLAGVFRGLPDADRLRLYRTAQLKSLVLTMAVSVAAAVLVPFSTGRALAIVVLGTVVGATRQRGRLERAIEARRVRMRIEIYTVNQLLAMRVRSGGGVMQAVTQVVERGSGEVVGELAEAVRLHRSGERSVAAFSRIASLTPEPFCARTYHLLALAEERGVDLAEGLLALAEDVREARREAIKRNATKRRAAMLVPTIAILAPVMLLFIGAPLPRIVLGWQ